MYRLFTSVKIYHERTGKANQPENVPVVLDKKKESIREGLF